MSQRTGERRTRLLLWSALCFLLLALNNLFLVIDVLLLPTANLAPFGQLASLSAVTVGRAELMMQSVSGLITMGYFIAGLSFLRFWSRTRDGLFAAFAVAFWLLATNQGLVAITGVPREEQTWFYLLRLVAFLLIIGAVVAKNRRSRSV